MPQSSINDRKHQGLLKIGEVFVDNEIADSKNSQEIVELLKMSNRKYGQTLVVITHDESIALQADRIIAIEDGHIVRDERIREAQK